MADKRVLIREKMLCEAPGQLILGAFKKRCQRDGDAENKVIIHSVFRVIMLQNDTISRTQLLSNSLICKIFFEP